MKRINEYIQYELENIPPSPPIITVIGDLNYDYIYNSPPLEQGKEIIISDFTRSLAGAAGYVSCGLAKLGANTSLCTQLGDDEEGRSLLDEIRACGVKTENIMLNPNSHTPFTFIFTQAREESPRQVATYLGTLEKLSIDLFDYRSLIEKSNLIYSCNYFLMPRLKDEIRYLFRFAKDRGVFTAYDANAGDGWEDETRLITLKKAIYPLTDIIFLNQREAYYLTKKKDPKEAIHEVDSHATTVVIKLGSKGSLIRHRGRVYHIEAFPLGPKIKDTVGAGDSYQAAFLFFYLRKLPIELCGILGSANAASTVQYSGGTKGQCNIKSILKFIQGFTIIDVGKGQIAIRR